MLTISRRCIFWLCLASTLFFKRINSVRGGPKLAGESGFSAPLPFSCEHQNISSAAAQPSQAGIIVFTTWACLLSQSAAGEPVRNPARPSPSLPPSLVCRGCSK